MPSGRESSRRTPAGFAKRLAAPSAAIVNRALISVGSASLSSASRSVAPVTHPPSNVGETASVRSRTRAPAFSARWISRWSNRPEA